MESQPAIRSLTQSDVWLEVMFNYASKTMSGGMDEYQYRPEKRWVTYAIKRGKVLPVRNSILGEFSKPMANDQYNPGYAEYKRISMIKGLAEQADQMGWKIDAMSMCDELLRHPEWFSASQRYGGQRNRVDEIEKKRDELTKAVSVQTARDHIERLVMVATKPESSGKAYELGLLAIVPLDHLVAQVDPIGFGLAAQLLSESDDSQSALAFMQQQADMLAEFLDASSDRDIQSKRDASVLQLAIDLTRMKLDDPETDELSRSIEQRIQAGIPWDQEAEATSDLVDVVQLTRLVSTVEHPLAKTWTDRLLESAPTDDRQLRDRMQVASTAGSIPVSERADELITKVQGRRAEGLTVSEKDSTLLLEMAVRLIEQKQTDLSAKTLQLALADGPPIATATMTKTDAFAVAANPVSSVRGNQDSTESRWQSKVFQAIDAWALHLGDADLAKPKPRDPFGVWEPFGTEPPDTIDDARKLYGVLSQSVFPESRSNETLGITMAPMDRNFDPFGGSNQTGKQRCLAVSLVRLAKWTDQLPACLTSAQERFEAKPNTEAAIIWVLAALASNDDEQVVTGLRALNSAIGDFLPIDDSSPTAVGNSYSTDDMARGRILFEGITPILVAILPVMESEQASRTALIESNRILKRVIGGVKADKYLANFNREFAKVLDQMAFRSTMQIGDSLDVTGRVLQMLRDTDSRYAGAAPRSSVLGQLRNEIGSLIRPAIDRGQIGVAAELAPVLTDSLNRRVVSNRFGAMFPLDVWQSLSDVSAQQRTKLLSDALLSKRELDASDDDLITRYIDPVPRSAIIEVNSVMSRFSAVTQDRTDKTDWSPENRERMELMENFSGIDSTLPLQDLMVLLADSAAQCGQSDVLIERLQQIERKPNASWAAVRALIGQADQIQNGSQASVLLSDVDDAMKLAIETARKIIEEQTKREAAKDDADAAANKILAESQDTDELMDQPRLLDLVVVMRRAVEHGVPRKPTLQEVQTVYAAASARNQWTLSESMLDLIMPEHQTGL